MSVEVEDVLKVRYDGLLAEFVVVEGMSEEMVKLGLEVQKVLWEKRKKALLKPSVRLSTSSSSEDTWIWSTGFRPASSWVNRAFPRRLTCELMWSQIIFTPPETRLKSQYKRAKSKKKKKKKRKARQHCSGAALLLLSLEVSESRSHLVSWCAQACE